MKGLKFILAGIIFGIIMVKSEAASFYRIQEMFRFQSFQMFGIMGVAVVIGIISIYLVKIFRLKDVEGDQIILAEKDSAWRKSLFGGCIFGLGWALTGLCPGPMFVNLGYGYWSALLVIGGALAGTLVYGMIRHKLPH